MRKPELIHCNLPLPHLFNLTSGSAGLSVWPLILVSVKQALTSVELVFSMSRRRSPYLKVGFRLLVGVCIYIYIYI